MNKKIYLEAPQAELIEVRFEEGLLTGTYGDEGQAGTLGPGNVYNFDDVDD